MDGLITKIESKEEIIYDDIYKILLTNKQSSVYDYIIDDKKSYEIKSFCISDLLYTTTNMLLIFEKYNIKYEYETTNVEKRNLIDKIIDKIIFFNFGDKKTIIKKLKNKENLQYLSYYRIKEYEIEIRKHKIFYAEHHDSCEVHFRILIDWNRDDIVKIINIDELFISNNKSCNIYKVINEKLIEESSLKYKIKKYFNIL